MAAADAQASTIAKAAARAQVTAKAKAAAHAQATAKVKAAAKAKAEPQTAANAEAQTAANAKATAELEALEVAAVEADDDLVTLLRERNMLYPVLLMGVRRLDELVECSVDALEKAGVQHYRATPLLRDARALVHSAAAAEVFMLHCGGVALSCKVFVLCTLLQHTIHAGKSKTGCRGSSRGNSSSPGSSSLSNTDY